MKSDLDAIMQASDVDALLVVGPAQHNPAMVYLTGGGHLTQAHLIKKRGEPAVLFHAAMERDEAAKSGLATRSYNQYPFKAFYEEAGGDPVVANALRYKRMLRDLGIQSGRVALYGTVDLSTAFPVFNELLEQMPEITLVSDLGSKILGEAMITKDEVEVARIRQMGHVTTEVVGKVAAYLSSRPVQDDVLVDEAGRPLTIGQVKGLINLWLAERGAENPEDTIFSIGRDAGVPHSSGSPQQVLRLGQAIVFDIFPCEAGGGYFYDFTRTWCLGYAPAEVQVAYEQVLSVYQAILNELEIGVSINHYQKRACDLFESMGHPTVQSDPNTEEGYVHGLGHGVGLKIHERPISSANAVEDDLLKPGMVITIEPGLYYPDQNFGVRLENTLYIRPDGQFEVMVDYPMDLVLPAGKTGM